jgi:uncharacterized protein YcfL
MRTLLPIIVLSLLCVGCSATKNRNGWFKTYQTDPTCQVIHPTHEDPFLRGPTGRAHPF